MKSKILAIVAVSTAALGSAILSAPAQAQITSTPATVGVNVTVPEVLYLRTVSTIDVDIPVSALTSETLTASGTGFTATENDGNTADGTNGVDTLSPFNTTNGEATASISIPNVFAVWSNSPRGQGVSVAAAIGTATLTSGGSTITLTSAAASPASAPVPGLVNPFIGGVNLGFTLGGNGISQAGDYTGGTITITASAL
ncbi:unknown protein [Nostoc sp. NIES-3756]|uniref:hypothetical protein n=1 Tax=Nostoc sp. NIES-3756 TaxID=1751286 RepID=UPI0007203F5D|nr:hypothetical protein [Nostoc sp. NIES-3756]BAT51099.1 unknown protein [Nostoc sp. NIES-3756]